MVYKIIISQSIVATRDHSNWCQKFLVLRICLFCWTGYVWLLKNKPKSLFWLYLTVVKWTIGGWLLSSQIFYEFGCIYLQFRIVLLTSTELPDHSCLTWCLIGTFFMVTVLPCQKSPCIHAVSKGWEEVITNHAYSAVLLWYWSACEKCMDLR